MSTTKIDSTNTQIYRTSFSFTLVNAAIAITALIAGGFLIAVLELHRGNSDVIMLGLFLFSCYITVIKFLPKKMIKESLHLWNQSKESYEDPGFSLFWGWIWRWFVITVLMSFPIGMLKTSDSSNEYNYLIFDLIILLICSFLAMAWLLKQQYGSLRVVSLEKEDWELVTTADGKREGNMFKKLSELTTGALGFVFIGIYILLAVGELYWLWMSFQIGSFGMFLVGMIPPFIILAMFVGAYGLIFGLPSWVYSFFG
jgi:hypothetical protein